MTLAEIIEEGERLEADVQSAIDLRMPTLADAAINIAHAFYVEHCSSLLALARAGAEMREAISVRHFEDAAGEDDHQWVLHEGLEQRIAAWDAAAGGEK